MAITYDTADDRIAAGTSASIAPYNAPWTFSVWVYPTIDDVPPTGGDPRLFEKGSVYVAFALVKLIYTSVAGSTPCEHFTADDSFVLNSWQHILVTSDGSTTAANYKIYVNGTEATYGGANTGTTPTSNLADTLYIGNNNNQDRPCGASLTECAFWNRVLTAAERALLYGSGSPDKGRPQLIPTGLQMYLPMDDVPSGSADAATIRDMSGNGNNGTGDNGANNTGLTWSADPTNLVAVRANPWGVTA